ncbi:uncharacterized protein [Venturia canescens]|uniref:uncharacterized protein n=1 Tax=Venturia canescens TaxID=32260 RepID=UPI001C9CD4B7|nr:uncharacterized protein LOC122416890 [Venturia canescens]
MNRDEQRRYKARMRMRRYRSMRKFSKDLHSPSTSFASVTRERNENITDGVTKIFDNENSESATSSINGGELNFNKHDSEGHTDNKESSGDELNRDSDGKFTNEESSEATSNNEESSEVESMNEESSEENSDGDRQCNEENQERRGHPVEENTEILELRKWAVAARIPQTQLDKLLEILRKRLLPELPKSSKTFLKTTSAMYEIEKFKDVDGAEIGDFVYFGIKHHLQRIVNSNLHKDNILYLQFNIDGISLFKSSSKQLWPILCKVFSEPDVYRVFPVAIYAGIEKPHVANMYFEKFNNEMLDLLREGIVIDGTLLEIRIICFICDKPARSFVKCIKNHGAYYACERCTVKGERYDERIIYPSTNCPERTNESFRRQEQPEHHRGVSPLLIIAELDMVMHFVLDFMHLCCLGLMKKLLEYWMKGDRKVKMSHTGKSILTYILLELQSQIPQEFQRTTRSLAEIAKWKATEFRFFLLYLGSVVLKKVLQDDLYKHFMLLHAACRILCSKDLALKFNEQAKTYLTRFVQLSEFYYGKQSQVLNMHSVIHLADDVKNLKCPLNNITAFPFESSLGKIKKMVRNGNRPLSQICRRYYEEFLVNTDKTEIPQAVIIVYKKVKKGIEPQRNRIIKKLQYKEFTLTNNSPDNTVMLQNGQILMINAIYKLSNQHQEEIKIAGKILSREKPIFEYPCNSQTLHMWKVKKTNINKTCALQNIQAKMVCLKIDDGSEEKKIYVMPLLHT